MLYEKNTNTDEDIIDTLKNTGLTEKSENNYFEFQINNGYFFEDEESGSVLVWHKCTDKAIYCSVDEIHLMRTRKTCFNCEKSVSNWEILKFIYMDKEVKFPILDKVTIDIDNFYIRITFLFSKYNLREKTFVSKIMTYRMIFTINIKTGWTYGFLKNDSNKKTFLSDGETYVETSSKDLPDNVLICLKNIINEKIREFHGNDTPYFEHHNVKLSLTNLMRFVRNPYINPDLIDRANSVSFFGKRGTLSESDYQSYAEKIMSWSISDNKKQQLLDKLHDKFSEMLKYQSQHVSVMVAGASNYDAKKLDKSDKILQLSAEFCEWFDDLQRQIEDNSRDNSKIPYYLRMIEFCDSDPTCDPTIYVAALAPLDNKKFIEIYERLRDKYKWRKNSNIYKLYEKSLQGDVAEIKKEVVCEDDDVTAYTEGDRAYIKFKMKPKRQLIIALRGRKWWWNSRENAWSTYLNNADWDWVRTISKRYSKYI